MSSNEDVKRPTWTPEVGQRLKLVIKDNGGLKNSARVAQASDDSVANWRDGKSEPSIFGLEALLRPRGWSMDWVLTGEGPQRRQELSGASGYGFDQVLMENIIDWYSTDLEKRDLDVPPRKFAAGCLAMYRLAIQQREKLREANVSADFTIDDFRIYQDIIQAATE